MSAIIWREMKPELELVLFENDPNDAERMVPAGISSFMVDMEVIGKNLRQLGFDTEIRPGTRNDLEAIANVDGATAWCRVNRYGAHTAAEIDDALAAGAKVLLLPMVTRLQEVEAMLGQVAGRCATGIMIETVEAVALAGQINQLGLHFAFFGLNDFAISRGGGSPFRALVDGSVDAVREAMPDTRLGVGGLTDIRCGHPIPARRLLEEFERLDCAFSFLRRSFRRDSLQVPAGDIVAGIRRAWGECRMRGAEARERDHAALAAIIRELPQ